VSSEPSCSSWWSCIWSAGYVDLAQIALNPMVFLNAPTLDGPLPWHADQIALREKQFMKRSMKDKAKGKFHEMKGKVKEKVGRVTNDPRLEAEGKGKKFGGKVQKKVGQVEKVLGV
jgi:uncharacterized protein YjbJ (UPF0337 family)